MKGLIRFAIVAAMFVAGVTTVSAQQVKLGYIKFDELVTSMPEYKAAGEEFEKKVQEIETKKEETNVEKENDGTAYSAFDGDSVS